MSRASRCASAAPCGMAASACRGRGLGGFTARAAPADGRRASRASAGTRPAPARSARRSRSAWSFDRFFTDGLSGRRWEGFEPSTGLFRSCSTRLSYTTVEAIRESNPAPCGAIHSMAASAAWDGAARAASTDESGCRTPARRACTRTAACERSPSAADSWAPGLQPRRDPFGRRAASHSIHSGPRIGSP
jgi:hypothetical protein